MVYGVVPTGFTQKTLTDILAEIEQSEKDGIDPGLDMSADGPLGVLNGIVAEKLSELWEVGLAVYRAFDPDSASGDALDNLAQLTGTTREAAAESTVTIKCTGTPLTSLVAGQVVSTAAGDRFESIADASLDSATAWAGSTAYVVDDIVTNDSNIYICTVAGTSAASGGPTGTGDGITDGTVTWNMVGDGTGYADVAFQSEETGPIAIDADTINTDAGAGTIETPVSGWDDARNTDDGIRGQDEETDTELRLRREEELTATGTATLESLIADVLRVDNVTQVKGFENVTDTTDVNGIPPHAFELIVLGGTNQDIADQIWASKAAGINAHGSTVVSVEDSQGDTHDIGFTRATTVDIYTKITYTTDDDYPDNGDDVVKAAIVAWGNALGVGQDVILSQIYDVVFDATTGIVDVTQILLDTVSPPVGTSNIAITDRQISDWDLTRVTLVVT